MDAQTIDQEFEKLQTEFQDVAKAVQGLATKLQAAHQAGDPNATEWLADLETIAKEVDDEQSQTKALLIALHSFIAGAPTPPPAQAAGDEKTPLFAPGQDPFPEGEQSQPQPQPQQGRHHGMLGGLLSGVGGGYMGGGYMSGGFGQAMEMGMGMQLGANLVNNIFR